MKNNMNLSFSQFFAQAMLCALSMQRTVLVVPGTTLCIIFSIYHRRRRTLNTSSTFHNGPPQRCQRHRHLPPGIHLRLPCTASISDSQIIRITTHTLTPLLQQSQHLHRHVRNSIGSTHLDHKRGLQTTSRQILPWQQRMVGMCQIPHHAHTTLTTLFWKTHVE